MWFRRDLRLADHPALARGAPTATWCPLFVVDPAFSSIRCAAAGLPGTTACRRSTSQIGRRARATGTATRSTVVPTLAAEVGVDAVFVSRDHGPYGRGRDAAVAAALHVDGRHLRGVGSPVRRRAGRGPQGRRHAVRRVHPVLEGRGARVGWDAPVGDAAATWTGSARPSRRADEPARSGPDPACALPLAGEHRCHAVAGTSSLARPASTATTTDATCPASTARAGCRRRCGGGRAPAPLLLDLSLGDSAGPRPCSRASSPGATSTPTCCSSRPESAWQNLNPKMDAMPVDTDDAARRRFERWCRGHDRLPIVDAGMRQFAATGWMHNRVRMIVASFLVKDLHLPWQWGARWFMHHLVDGDLASNNHGWQWAAGTGHRRRAVLPGVQPDDAAERYDPTASTCAGGCPSSGIDDTAMHEPGLSDPTGIRRRWSTTPSSATRRSARYRQATSRHGSLAATPEPSLALWGTCSMIARPRSCSAVVQEYIATAQPVGSTLIADAPGVHVSSATVRNEMAVLEQEGYLVQPHTSAGRIPTDKGYRFFVDHLADARPARLRRRPSRWASSSPPPTAASRSCSTRRRTCSPDDQQRRTRGRARRPRRAVVRSVQLVSLSARWRRWWWCWRTARSRTRPSSCAASCRRRARVGSERPICSARSTGCARIGASACRRPVTRESTRMCASAQRALRLGRVTGEHVFIGGCRRWRQRSMRSSRCARCCRPSSSSSSWCRSSATSSTGGCRWRSGSSTASSRSRRARSWSRPWSSTASTSARSACSARPG